MKPRTQNEIVIERLERYGSVTQMQMINQGIYRLAARINEIKELPKYAGRIKAVMVKARKANGRTTHIADYVLQRKKGRHA